MFSTYYTISNETPKMNEMPGPVKEYNFNRNILKRTELLKELNLFNENPSVDFRQPMINNPMMNVPITAYDTEQLYSDYDRYLDTNSVTSNTINVDTNVEKYLENNLFQDPGDYFFGKTNSQRQWYSVPVGSVPNKQDVFANWLYSTPGNCKNGSIWMSKGVMYTDDSLLCTGFNAAEPTNFGILKK